MTMIADRPAEVEDCVSSSDLAPASSGGFPSTSQYRFLVEVAMGMSGTAHGGSGLTEKQEQFGRLVGQGLSNSEACRVVGINRRTGTRWRYGRMVRSTAGEAVHYPAVCPLKPTKPRRPRYLSLEERTMIADLVRAKKTMREIAAELGRSPATISRELRRNADVTGRYLPGTADRLTSARAAPRRHRRVSLDAELRAVVVELLRKRWSPEQVAHELRERFPNQPGRQLCTESIYQAIYATDVDVTRPARRRDVDVAAAHECRVWNVVAGSVE